eukprot:gnl/Hemi2/11336_TR3920_c0_g1_i1.p1 gnl/Hemi2/11336_TR3920_c0_g1~~gnl/Hemi2/11336_TR3920_c0_g1_i1.p1  ORF type:complete len:300 (-),score=63.79 gnl/Hemi2/11336_TR3920_c0_g1_i1:167-1066(-)
MGYSFWVPLPDGVRADLGAALDDLKRHCSQEIVVTLVRVFGGSSIPQTSFDPHTWPQAGRESLDIIKLVIKGVSTRWVECLTGPAYEISRCHSHLRAPNHSGNIVSVHILSGSIREEYEMALMLADSFSRQFLGGTVFSEESVEMRPGVSIEQREKLISRVEVQSLLYMANSKLGQRADLVLDCAVGAYRVPFSRLPHNPKQARALLKRIQAHQWPPTPEQIAQEAERALAVKQKYSNLTCAHCGRVAAMECSSCKATFYCGTKCQRNHWLEQHRNYCVPVEGDMSFELGPTGKPIPHY